MTCNQFRQIVSTVDPICVTRAIRLAVIQHLTDCPHCEEWLEAVTHEDESPDADHSDLDALIEEDRKDPEFKLRGEF
jgi:hypothetical protein